jgi:lysozyme
VGEIAMDELEAKILDHEGLRLFPYLDTADKWTIGAGRNLSDRGISRDEAMYLLRNDIAESRLELSHYDWFNNMDKVRQEVLIELHFNIGLAKLLGFKNMIAYLKQGYYYNASLQLRKSLWARQVGQTRSQDMANRLNTGRYSG